MRLKADNAAYSVAATVENETNDCGVRALMVAGCMSYAAAHAACKSGGRANRTGMYDYQMDRALRAAGFNVRQQGYAPTVKEYFRKPRWDRAYLSDSDGPARVRRLVYKTLAEFVASHASGHYIVELKTHFCAVCDGVVHDWQRAKGKAGARRDVVGFWKLV